MPIYPYSFQLPPLNVQDIPNDGAPGEFLGINVGGQLDWLPAGGGGSGDMLAANNLSELTNFATARTNIGLGTASTPTFANLTLTSPSLLSSAPVTISQTWGTLNATYTAFKVVATETAVASTVSNLLELWSGSTPTLKVNADKSGNFAVTGTILADSNRSAFRDGGVTIGNAGALQWSQSSTAGATRDLFLVRDAANTLALRNGTAAQTFRVYNTFPGNGNNEYGEITWDASTLYFRPAATGTAAIRNTVIGSSGSVTNLDATVITFRPGGASRFVINSGGLFATNDNQVDIGSSGGNRPRDIFLTGTLYSNTIRDSTTGVLSFVTTGSTRMTITGTGNVGIGTTAPGAKLEVVGNILVNGATQIIDDGNILSVKGSTTNAFKAGYIVVTSGDNLVTTYQGSVTSGGFFGTFTNHKCFIRTNNVERVAIDTAGNVGIGTTSPTSKLHVVGDARITTDVFASAVYGFAGANTTCGINGSDGVGPIIHANQNGKIGFFSGTSFSGVMDTVLVRDGAANTLALRNGTSAQRFNVYNSYLNAGVDYERMGIGDIPAIAGNVGLYYARAGSGAAKGIYIWNDSNSSIVLSTNATNRWQILNTGHLHAWTDNQFDIGASGANRPRNVYAGSSFQSGSGNAGGLYIGAFGGVTSFSNGVFTWWNNTVNNFDRFQLGGTTDVFPAIARDGAGIKFTGAAAGSTAWIKVPPVAVSALPLAATAGAGARAFVNDASSPTFGSAVTGGGAVLVPVYSTGSAWNVG